nr:hypothetical protein [Roseateles sp.]
MVEAKEASLPAETGVQQVREYAEALGLKLACATNGHRIIEIDYLAGTEREVTLVCKRLVRGGRRALVLVAPADRFSLSRSPNWKAVGTPTRLHCLEWLPFVQNAGQKLMF